MQSPRPRRPRSTADARRPATGLQLRCCAAANRSAWPHHAPVPTRARTISICPTGCVPSPRSPRSSPVAVPPASAPGLRLRCCAAAYRSAWPRHAPVPTRARTICLGGCGSRVGRHRRRVASAASCRGEAGSASGRGSRPRGQRRHRRPHRRRVASAASCRGSFEAGRASAWGSNV